MIYRRKKSEERSQYSQEMRWALKSDSAHSAFRTRGQRSCLRSSFFLWSWNETHKSHENTLSFQTYDSTHLCVGCIFWSQNIPPIPHYWPNIVRQNSWNMYFLGWAVLSLLSPAIRSTISIKAVVSQSQDRDYADELTLFPLEAVSRSFKTSARKSSSSKSLLFFGSIFFSVASFSRTSFSLYKGENIAFRENELNYNSLV